MKYIEPTNFEEIIQYIEVTLRRVRGNELTVADGASNIVGATIANSSVNLRTLYESHPRLEELAELCADMETYDAAKKLVNDPTLQRDVAELWADIEACFKAVQKQN